MVALMSMRKSRTDSSFLLREPIIQNVPAECRCIMSPEELRMNVTRAFLFAISAIALAACCQMGAAADKMDLQLTYPNGRSPKVFTIGWTFGAKAVLNPGTRDSKDLSKQVSWSGSGTFSPKTGAVSHPSFLKPGSNTIILTVTLGKQKFTKSFTVQAVTPNHATVGDKAYCAADAHGCPSCPHAVVGHILTGNAKVRINGKPVACAGDTGTHATCCGPNTFKIVSGDPSILVDGKPVARLGDKTEHCGGLGKIVSASFAPGKTFTGSFSGGASGTATFTIDGSKATGTFKGGHGSDGGGSVDVKLDGTYSAKTGAAKGTMSGTATYVGLDNKRSTASVKGTFRGTVQGNSFTGTWSVTASGMVDRKVTGAFSTKRPGK